MDTESHKTVVEAIAEELANAGVDRVFGLPGGEVLQLIDALRRKGIEFVLCRHEAHAGIMAAVYGKVRGTAGVVLTTLGPGAANLGLPLTNSLLDREPLVAISAEIPHSWPASHTHQRLPLHEMYGPVVKYTDSLNSFNARRAVQRAVAASLEEPHGPTYLTISAENALATSFEPAGNGVARSNGVPKLGDPVAAVKELTEKLAAAERPLVVLGIGVQPSNAEPLRQWLKNWGLPVAVTPKIKGIVDERDEHFLGTIGGMSLDGLMMEALNQSDLIVGFGFDPVESDKIWHAQLPLLWVLESPQAMGVVPASDLLGVDHRSLLDVLSQRSAPRGWGDPFSDVKARRRAVYESSNDGSAIPPVSLVRELAEQLPRETVVVTDVGAHKYLFGQFWPSRDPQSFFMSNGLSGMGYGLPGAIGAKLARPDLPVLAVVGDGGFSMFSQELETAKRYGVQVNALVLADGSYSLIRMGQASRGLPQYGVDFAPIDSVATAESCGIRGLRAESLDEAVPAMGDAIAQGESLVVEVPIDPASYKELT